ncbi:MAG: hypothetical protein GXP13_03345 [Gammaproteobacteria bacterium]|nr:hypothetical protein [Gammaproteobacteria bacterium]
MKKLKTITISGALLLLQACANPLHYYWSYVPLQNPKDDMFIQSNGDVNYIEVDDMEKASAEMHVKGFIMMGYCYMDSPQLEFVGVRASQKWGNELGVDTVILKYGDGNYLATYWSKPKTYILGAYYKDMSAEFRQKKRIKQGVMVVSVVDGSPAYHAEIKTGEYTVIYEWLSYREFDNFELYVE